MFRYFFNICVTSNFSTNYKKKILSYRIVLPLVIREITSICLGKFGSLSAHDSLDLSMFGFLYGMIPSAPAVFVYASAYNLEMDLVCTIYIFILSYNSYSIVS